MYRLIALAYVAALLFVNPASADARPRINLVKAERVAAEYVEGFAAPDAAEPGDDPNVIYSTGASLAGCDVETRYRVLCDIEVAWEDGAVDEAVLTVLVTRRGTYVIQAN